MKNLSYTELEVQGYMVSPLFCKDQISLLLSLRTRTVRGIRTHFGNLFPDKCCPLPDCNEMDSLQHVLECRVLLELQRHSVTTNTITYMDVFSSDTSKQHEVTAVYAELLDARQTLMIEDDRT